LLDRKFQQVGNSVRDGRASRPELHFAIGHFAPAHWCWPRCSTAQLPSGVRKRLASLSEHERTLTERSAALQKERTKLQDAIVAGHALATFLLTSTDLSHPFWTLIDRVRAFKERRPGPAEALFTPAIKQEVAKFLARIASMPAPVTPAQTS